MDAALKQRLIGAAVLVALAVIFLPMLVDGPEPQTGTSSVPLDIPAPPERNFETRELPVAPTTPAPAAASADPGRIVTVEADNAAPVEAMPEDLAPAATPEASAPTPPASAASAATPLETPAATTPTTGALPAVTPGGRYVVNLGSYGNAANAQALVAAFEKAGLAAYADNIQIDGKPGRRVRVGPFAQRGEAEAARLVATRLRPDVPASVVAIEAEEAAMAPAPARTALTGGFAVQIGALTSEADANTLRDRARGAGFTAYVERADTGSGPLFRVRVGPELQRGSAETLKASLKQKLAVDGVVVTHP